MGGERSGTPRLASDLRHRHALAAEGDQADEGDREESASWLAHSVPHARILRGPAAGRGDSFRPRRPADCPQSSGNRQPPRPPFPAAHRFANRRGLCEDDARAGADGRPASIPDPAATWEPPDGRAPRLAPPARRDHAGDGADLPLPDDHHLRGQPLHPRRRRRPLDHPRAGRQGEPHPRRYRPRPAGRDGRRAAQTVLGTPVPSRDLYRATGHRGDRPRPPGGAGRLQYRPQGPPIPACSARPARSAAPWGSPPTPCPAARPWAAASPTPSPRGPIASSWRTTASSPAAGTSRTPLSGSRPWSSAPRPSSRPASSARSRYLDDRAAEQPRPTATDPAPADPGPATSPEKELRRQLGEFVRRCYRQRLMISTQGAFSARLDAESFVITPHRVDRSTLDAADMVLIRGGSAEAGRVPSTSARNHAAIYAAHPEIHAIVNAYPVNATAFGVGAAALDTRTIPESYVFLRDVRRAPYGVQLGDGSELARLASLRNPALILENDGVQVCGSNVLDAFDRLEVLEATAEAAHQCNHRERGDDLSHAGRRDRGFAAGLRDGMTGSGRTMAKKVALVAGASGIVGRGIVEELARHDDWEVIGLARNPPEDPVGPVPRGRPARPERCPGETGRADRRHPPVLRRLPGQGDRGGPGDRQPGPPAKPRRGGRARRPRPEAHQPHGGGQGVRLPVRALQDPREGVRPQAHPTQLLL